MASQRMIAGTVVVSSARRSMAVAGEDHIADACHPGRQVAHATRLACGDEDGVVQREQSPMTRGHAERDDLGMGGGIIVACNPVRAGAQDFPALMRNQRPEGESALPHMLCRLRGDYLDQGVESVGLFIDGQNVCSSVPDLSS